MPKELAIVLNNGTINSAVATALAQQKYRPILAFGEIEAVEPTPKSRLAYDLQVGHFKPFREHTIPVPYFALAREAAFAAGDPRANEPVQPTLRKLAPLLGAAVTLAAAYDAGSIYLGLRVGPATDELAQAVEFLQIWAEMVQMTLGKPDLDIVAPLIELEPWQVVDLGFQVGAPLERTWGCVEESGDPCGTCRGCRSRDAAFMQAAKPDPSKPVRRS